MARVLAFAGLWELWHDPASWGEILFCTIIALEASDWAALYHDRMPLTQSARDTEGWLDGSLSGEALRPASESALREWIVLSPVNPTGAGGGDPTIVETVESVA